MTSRPCCCQLVCGECRAFGMCGVLRSAVYRLLPTATGDRITMPVLLKDELSLYRVARRKAQAIFSVLFNSWAVLFCTADGRSTQNPVLQQLLFLLLFITLLLLLRNCGIAICVYL